MPKISIIIVNWNGKTYLEKCLPSISGQTFTDYELIVVDNGSSDDSVTYVQNARPDAKLLRFDRNLGFCRGNNEGISIATGKYLFLLNNDTILPENCLAVLSDQMEVAPPHCIGIFPKVVFQNVPVVINAFGAIWTKEMFWHDPRAGLLDLGQFVNSEPVFGSIFPAVLLDKEKFARIGLFDEEFFSYSEDFDVCYRANILGYKFYTAPNAIVLHRHRGSSQAETDPMWSDYFFYRNSLQIFLKNYQLSSLIVSFPAIIKRYIMRPTWWAVRSRNFARLSAVMRATASVIRMLPSILARRRRVQKCRKLSDKQVWSSKPVWSYGVFYLEGHILLNQLNIETALKGPVAYRVDGRTFMTGP